RRRWPRAAGAPARASALSPDGGDERRKLLHPLVDRPAGVHGDLELAARQLPHLAGRGGPERYDEHLAMDAERVGHREDGVDLLHRHDLEHDSPAPWDYRFGATAWICFHVASSMGIPSARRSRSVRASGSPGTRISLAPAASGAERTQSISAATCAWNSAAGMKRTGSRHTMSVPLRKTDFSPLAAPAPERMPARISTASDSP